MDYFERQALRRRELMPKSQRAWDYWHDATVRLKELGWRKGKVPEGQLCQMVFEGSPLIHCRRYDGCEGPDCWYRPIGAAEKPRLSAEEVARMVEAARRPAA
ncbi:MAG: hypothetical protein ACREE2_00850 [Stellaceae bacterium]